MAQVELFKRKGTYKDKKTGEDKNFTNFFVRCGDELIPIEVKFFENDDGRDPRYSARRAVLSAFAVVLPEREGQSKDSKRSEIVEDDDAIPFNR